MPPPYFILPLVKALRKLERHGIHFPPAMLIESCYRMRAIKGFTLMAVLVDITQQPAITSASVGSNNMVSQDDLKMCTAADHLLKCRLL